MKRIFATKNPEVSEREVRNMVRARKIAAQGMVLLKNEGILPLESGKKIALFGDGVRYTVKGGTGSGDVNSRNVICVEQGLEAAGFCITTKAWLSRYDKVVEEAQSAYIGKIQAAMATEGEAAFAKIFFDPFREPPVLQIEEEDVKNSDTDTAIYVLARNSGEGKDRCPVKGEYELREEEKAAIKMIAAHYQKVIVVLNVGGVVDTKFIRNTEGIGAILLMGQAGNIGGHALADVLSGAVTPSGHLTATWAENYLDYPNAANYSHMNGDVDDEYYTEGIYVGYRYFDSFGIAPAYPFGYGLSYTTFSVKTKNVIVEDGTVLAEVEVTNTGDSYTGREVVQAYYSAPKGSLEKPYQELAAYAKTKELKPGESQTLTLSWAVEKMASYDPKKAAWLLEAGTYYVRIGTHSRNTHIAAAIELDQTAYTKQLKNLLPLDCEMELLSAAEEFPYTYEEEETEKKSAARLRIQAKKIQCTEASYSKESISIPNPSKEYMITMDDVRTQKATLDELVGQLTVEEMATICIGAARGGFGGQSIIGAASKLCPGAAGETTRELLESRNIRNMIFADGPAGLRLTKCFMVNPDESIVPGTEGLPIPGLDMIMKDMPGPEIPTDAVAHYQYCTAIPIATVLAQTWDLKMIEEAGDIVGEEMEEFGITLWLAPGMNIQRNPLCGRNFEYYSEDPLVTGLCAAADTRGVQKHPGVGTTIKHLAFNNQEDNRMLSNAHIEERAIREIYLKGFEIAIETCQPMAIMTSYNLINGTHTANSRDLLTSIVRDEWKFNGIIMTDWGTTGIHAEGMEQMSGQKTKYDFANAAGCIKAGNDLTMPGSQADVDEVARSIGADEGTLPYPITVGDLQACTKRVLNIALQSSAYDGSVPYSL